MKVITNFQNDCLKTFQTRVYTSSRAQKRDFMKNTFEKKNSTCKAWKRLLTLMAFNNETKRSLK